MSAFELEVLSELRQIKGHLAALAEAVSGEELSALSCPGCGTSDAEKVIPSPAMGDDNRMSCLACGTSWRNE